MGISTFRAGPPSQQLCFQVREIEERASWALVKVTMLGELPASKIGMGSTKRDATWDALEGIVPALVTDPNSSFYKEVKRQLETLFLPSLV